MSNAKTIPAGFGPEAGKGLDRPWQPPAEPLRLMPRTNVMPLDFKHGIDESLENTMVPTGWLVSCNNWVPEQVGGVRVRWAWQETSQDRQGGRDHGGDAQNHGHDLPSVFRTAGLHYTQLSDGPSDAAGGQWWVAVIYNDNEGGAAQLWATRALSGFTNGWNFVAQMSNRAGDPMTDVDFYPVALQTVAAPPSVGGAWLLISHPEQLRVSYWDGTIPSTITSIPQTQWDGPKTQARPGRALAYYRKHYFIGGSSPNLDNITYRLYFSGLTPDPENAPDPTLWPDQNFIDIGKGDGAPIQTLQTFQGALLVGKSSGVYILTGDDLQTFAVNRLEGTQVAKGRSIIPTPTGAVILGDHDVYFWNGGDPQRIGQPVQNTYATIDPGSPRFGCYVAGKVWITTLGGNSPMFSFDPLTGVWVTEDTGTDNERPTSCDGKNLFQLGVALKNTHRTGPMLWREMPYGPRGRDSFLGADTKYSMQFPDTWLTHERAPVTLRQLWFRVRRHDYGSTDSPTPPRVTVRLDGANYHTYDLNIPDADGGVAWTRRSFTGKTAKALGFICKHGHEAGPLVSSPVFSIEEVLVDVDIDPWR